MSEWVAPVAVEDHMERRVVYADGDIRRDVDVTFTEEQYRKMQNGYICVRCYGHVDTAFPETCGFPGCDGYPNGFPMRKRQREVMEQEYDGLKWVGPSRSMIDSIENTIWTPPKRS